MLLEVACIARRAIPMDRHKINLASSALIEEVLEIGQAHDALAVRHGGCTESHCPSQRVHPLLVSSYCGSEIDATASIPTEIWFVEGENGRGVVICNRILHVRSPDRGEIRGSGPEHRDEVESGVVAGTVLTNCIRARIIIISPGYFGVLAFEGKWGGKGRIIVSKAPFSVILDWF